jgi:hypothetical protein
MATEHTMHCIVRPLANPRIRLDLSDCLVEAIARELGRRFGGNPLLNRLEAEAHLGQLLRAQQAHAEPPQFNLTTTLNLEEMTDDLATSSDRSM